MPNGVFNDFISIVIKVALSSGVSGADVMTMGALLGSTKASIVDPNVGDGGYFNPG